MHLGLKMVSQRRDLVCFPECVDDEVRVANECDLSGGKMNAKRK